MTIPFPVRLGRQLCRLREQRGFSQTQLAELTGIRQSHLSQIENGAVAVRIDTLYALAQTLGLKMEEIFRGM
jgi:transcriptional regulator with XRE-family HTH domain